MSETLIKRLRDEAGLTGRALATKAGLNSGQLSKIEAGEHGLSEKTASGLGEALGVDPMLLMVAQGFDAMHARAEKGDISPREVAVKGAQLLQLAHETPGLLTESEFQRFVSIGQDIHQLAEKAAGRAATKSRAGGDTMDLLGRDGVGRSARKAVGGAEPLGSYRNESVPVDTPLNAAVTNPTAEALASAVDGLEERIDRGEVSGHQILIEVGNILNSYQQLATSDDETTRDAYRRLKALADAASKEIGSTVGSNGASDRWAGDDRGPGGLSRKRGTSFAGHEPGDHRGAGGVSRNKLV